MTFSSTKNFFFVILIFTKFIAGCASASHEEMSASSKLGAKENKLGLANPSAKFCIDHGGQIEMYTNEAGQGGFCNVGGGIIEEWTLFRYLNDPAQTRTKAVSVFLSHPTIEVSPGNGGANPASLYCLEMGGTNPGYQSAEGTVGICVFPDRSAIEEWTLFRGPDASSNEKLRKLLNSSTQ